MAWKYVILNIALRAAQRIRSLKKLHGIIMASVLGLYFTVFYQMVIPNEPLPYDKFVLFDGNRMR